MKGQVEQIQVPKTTRYDVDQQEQFIFVSNKQNITFPSTDSQLNEAKVKLHKPRYKNQFIKPLLILILFLIVFGWAYQKQNVINETNKHSSPDSAIEIYQISEKKEMSSQPNKIKNVQNQKKDSRPKESIKDSAQNNQNKERNKQQIKSTQVKEATVTNKKKYSQQEALIKYHPWELTKQAKQNLFNKYKNMPEKKSNQSVYMPIVQNYEKEILPILQEFQKTSEVVKYSQIKMTQKQLIQYQRWYNQKLASRLQYIDKLAKKQSSFVSNPNGLFSRPESKITRKQWYSSFQYHSLVGINLNAKEIKKDDIDIGKARRIASDQIQYYQSKYNIGKYTNQLRICLVSPGFNNQKRERYLWNVESILQQNYSNYRMVIIDDASTDKSSTLLAKHLKWRNVSEDKITFLKNTKHKVATLNVFYATHKYCDFGEIQIVLDQDDELIGRQIFKTLNAVYQKQKILTMYSNYVYQGGDPNTNPNNLVGFPRDYLPIDIQTNNYRRTRVRGYSHLRTMLSDNFLLIKPESLQDWNGDFYYIISDNAEYYPALEMSCGKVKYLPQLFVYYNANTGLNDQLHLKQQQTKLKSQKVYRHITDQKSYRCLALQFFQISQYKA